MIAKNSFICYYILMAEVGTRRFSKQDDFGLEQLTTQVIPDFAQAGADPKRDVVTGFAIDNFETQHPEQMLGLRTDFGDFWRQATAELSPGEKLGMDQFETVLKQTRRIPELHVVQIAPFIGPKSPLGRIALAQTQDYPEWGIFGNGAVTRALHLDSRKVYENVPTLAFYFDDDGQVQTRYSSVEFPDFLERDECLDELGEREYEKMKDFAPNAEDWQTVGQVERDFIENISRGLADEYDDTPFALSGSGSTLGEVHRPLRTVASYRNQIIVEANLSGNYERALELVNDGLQDIELKVIAGGLRYAQGRPTEVDISLKGTILDYWGNPSEIATRTGAPVLLGRTDRDIVAAGRRNIQDDLEEAVIVAIQDHHRGDSHDMSIRDVTAAGTMDAIEMDLFLGTGDAYRKSLGNLGKKLKGSPKSLHFKRPRRR